MKSISNAQFVFPEVAPTFRDRLMETRIEKHFSTIIQWTFIAVSLKQCTTDTFLYHNNNVKFDRDALQQSLNLILEEGFEKEFTKMVGTSFNLKILHRFILSDVSVHDLKLVTRTSVQV